MKKRVSWSASLRFARCVAFARRVVFAAWPGVGIRLGEVRPESCLLWNDGRGGGSHFGEEALLMGLFNVNCTHVSHDV